MNSCHVNFWSLGLLHKLWHSNAQSKNSLHRFPQTDCFSLLWDFGIVFCLFLSLSFFFSFFLSFCVMVHAIVHNFVCGLGWGVVMLHNFALFFGVTVHFFPLFWVSWCIILLCIWWHGVWLCCYVQVRYFAEVAVCLSCVITVITEGIEIGTQGLPTFLKNCVSWLLVDLP